MKVSVRKTQRGRFFSALALGALGTLSLAACWPGDVTSLAQLDLVVTVHDSSANFRNMTYVLPDSVVEVDLGSENQIPLDRSFDDQILADVAAQMDAKGYTRVSTQEATNNGADYVVLVEASAHTVTSYYAVYPWCGGWGWWGGWGWYGGCYPGYYPPAVGSTTYESGTIFVNLIDACDQDMRRCKRIWIGALNGVLASNPTGQRITSGIQRMYDQSPYLGPNATTN